MRKNAIDYAFLFSLGKINLRINGKCEEICQNMTQFTNCPILN